MDIYDKLGFDQSKIVDKEIDISKFTNSSKLKKEDIKILNTYCDKIYLKYKYDCDNPNLEKLNNEDSLYNELFVLEGKINSALACYDIMYSIGHLILYPIIIFFKFGTKFKIGISKAYIGLKDSSVNIQNSIILTPWIRENFIISQNKKMIEDINKIKIDKCSNLKEFHNQIYQAVLYNQASYIYLPKFIRLLKHTLGIKNGKEKELKNEIINYCSEIHIKNISGNKYNRNKLEKYSYADGAYTGILYEIQELWDFLNQDEYYRKILECKKIESYVELESSDMHELYEEN